MSIRALKESIMAIFLMLIRALVKPIVNKLISVRLWLRDTADYLSYRRFLFTQLLRNQVWCRKKKLHRWFRYSFPGIAYLFADTDVLLSIHPLHKRHKSALTYHYPPPGYGLPPNYTPPQNAIAHSETNKVIEELREVEAYGLHLWPGRIWHILLLYMLFMFPLMLLPLSQIEPTDLIIKNNLTGIIGGIDTFFLQPCYDFCKNYWQWMTVPLLLIILFYFLELKRLLIGLLSPLLKLWYGLRVLKNNIKTNTADTMKRLILYCLLIGLLIGFLFSLYLSASYEDNRYYFLSWLLSVMIFLLIFRRVFFRTPPLINNVWKRWPITQYKLFLNVPHHVALSWKDQLIDRRKIINDNALSRYWRRDDNTSFFQQSTSYAKNQKTLQEVMLHLALFDFLFHPKEQKSKKNKKGKAKEQSRFSSLKFKNWLFLLSPVWLSLIMLLLSLTLMALFPKNTFCSLSGGIISNYPTNFIWAALVWLIISFFFMSRWLMELNKLNNDIHKGYFNTHLKLVPQQILGAMTEIPDPSQVREAISTLQRILNITMATLFTAILVILEILSN